jgi:hypothetical protein
MSTLTVELEEDVLRGQPEHRREAWERFRRMMREHPVEVGERTWIREDLHER